MFRFKALTVGIGNHLKVELSNIILWLILKLSTREIYRDMVEMILLTFVS